MYLSSHSVEEAEESIEERERSVDRDQFDSASRLFSCIDQHYDRMGKASRSSESPTDLHVPV